MVAYQNSKPSVLVVNGPNLNMLGQREPDVYGRATLADIERDCAAEADRLGVDVAFVQSNHEGQLIDWIQDARTQRAGIVINPAGLTHTSVALLDALLASALPVIEVHLSNIHRREEFRRHSYVSRAAIGVICGLGPQGYTLALQAMADFIKNGKTNRI